jgi:hypothetical protein
MTAETLTGARATTRALKAAHGIQTAGMGMFLHGWYPVAVAAIEDGDIWEMLWIPRRTLIFGGHLVTDDLDTHATGQLDLDLGWAANGGEQTEQYKYNHEVAGSDVTATDVVLDNAGYQASVDGFGNFGVFDNDAVTNIKPVTTKVYRPILLSRPLYFSRDTKVQMEANAAQATAAAGDAMVVLWGQRV